MNKIVIAGGTGFLGNYLAARFREKYNEVIIISRNRGDVQWSDSDGLIRALNGADILINLAGKSVDCRYNRKNREAILRSRVETTRLLSNAIQQCKEPPKLWINSSTATIYRHAEDRPMIETDGEIGTGFSVNVAQQWEQAFLSASLPATRRVALRMAIVLGKQGGVMQPLNRLVKLGLGGRQGSGKQMFSWIHIEDLYKIIMFLKSREDLDGVFNCSAPNPVTNDVLMKELRTKLNVLFGLSATKWMLEFGAFFIRTETELVLKSRWVIPERLLQSGFTFKYPKLSEALDEVLSTATTAESKAQLSVKSV